MARKSGAKHGKPIVDDGYPEGGSWVVERGKGARYVVVGWRKAVVVGLRYFVSGHVGRRDVVERVALRNPPLRFEVEIWKGRAEAEGGWMWVRR